ncbi:MAG TPA: SH3-like domain-containing protein [Pseudonocardia sp.]|nr:SH3-like domain-containing protein [Pseudonocardia sp.]
MDLSDDLGGTPGWGSLHAPDPHEPVFAQPWYGRTFAMTVLTIGGISGRNLDNFRYTLASLSHDAYHGDGYYGRWLRAAEAMLVDSAILAPGAVEARARVLRGEATSEPEVPEPAKPDYTPAGPGSLRTIDAPPAFALGQRVRALAAKPADASRLPAYVRGHTGTVDALQPASVLPDTNAVFEGENPQHVYSVRFGSRELWGADAEDFDLTIELFESYLEADG